MELNASNKELLQSILIAYDLNNNLASSMEKHSNNYATVTEEIFESGEHGTKHADSVVGVKIDARDAFDISLVTKIK